MSEEEVAALVTPEPVERELPGAVLRTAREMQGLTLGEVAATLKFSTRQIEALESNDFVQLQGATFLRGFIRAYARLLKLAPEPLLVLLQAETLPVQEQIVAPGNMGETDPEPFYRRHGRELLVIALVLLALLAGGLVFLDEEPGTTGRTEAVSVALPSLHVDAQGGQHAADAGSPSPPPSAVTGQTLIFEFSDLSWLEVKDGSGQIVLTGEFPAGDRQTVAGKPPYQLWIGKASAVKLTYADHAVDLQPYTREDVARLTLE